MRVVHAQAERILAEYPDGVPGYETLEYKLGSPDKHGHADLETGGHASPEAFAKAAGIVEASPPQVEVRCIQLPEIQGLPNVGQHVTASAGIWEEPDPDELGDPARVSRPGSWIQWLYDSNEEDPVVIPEGDPHGGRQLHIPAAAIGRTITIRVTRGATTVYSKPFGPIEGGLTEYTFPAQPVRDQDVVSAEPAGRRIDGSSSRAGGKVKNPTPTSGVAKSSAQGTGPKKPSGPKPATKPSKAQALAKRAAKDDTPPPAQDEVDV